MAIPCYNEALTIGKVIDDFKAQLPEASILVVDNNSSDDTGAIAAGKGAQVIVEKKQGKGFAVQKIFDECKSDIMVLVDGDDTYPAHEVKKLLQPIIDGIADMVVGHRIHPANEKSFTTSHWLGNKFLTHTLNLIF